MATVTSPSVGSSSLSEPSSPSSPLHLRNRGGATSSSIFMAGGFREAASVSPTLSSFSSGSNALALAAGSGSSLGAHAHKIVIKVDHSIATSFDLADKELYDLWAPKP
ncbi:hypothetical protein B0F90DRAFT_532230 [Multifurca ochricompacta]|uniref:Uncharacterized protein n=1 Tax=Multifurca ochricompacta TaxID=376703 RepID=A0AAD4MC47_9AGAM|nr:hypothetical protein B0F90DRAFT_532230 [Multifurca ochricompacta]